MNKDLEIINSYIAPKEFDYRRGAFTLAEVLITLGIIGVVAAMTIPTLVSNYQKKVEETKYKKAKSMIANQFKLLFAQENLTGIKNSSIEKFGPGEERTSQELRKVFKVVEDAYVYNYKGSWDKRNQLESIVYTAEDSTKKPTAGWLWRTDVYNVFKTTDGMVYGYTPFEDGNYSIFPATNGSFFVQVDTNGAAGPNIVGRDFFRFKVDSNTNVFDITSSLISGDCSRSNPSGCASQDECYALGDGTTRYPGAGSQYVDENNYCHTYAWNSSVSRCVVSHSAPNMDGSVNYYCQ